jgi:hypothetical protein
MKLSKFTLRVGKELNALTENIENLLLIWVVLKIVSK